MSSVGFTHGHSLGHSFGHGRAPAHAPASPPRPSPASIRSSARRCRRGTAGSSSTPRSMPVLGGGLACGALHELAPAVPIHLGAATGFAMALAARAAPAPGAARCFGSRPISPAREAGGPYGPGLDLFGLALGAPAGAARAARGRCALGDGGGAALPRARLRHRRADRRGRRRRSHRDAPPVARGARGRSARSLGLPAAPSRRPMPSAAATRWQIAAAREPARSPTAGSASRRASTFLFARTGADLAAGGSSSWDHHERVFQPALSVGVAAAALDRPDRAPLRRTG